MSSTLATAGPGLLQLCNGLPMPEQLHESACSRCKLELSEVLDERFHMPLESVIFFLSSSQLLSIT